ncbi:MAG: S8 family peptidase [Bacteroidia bacterium]|nr:S8 family peptidase [Bacteroidia bacterium]
MRVLRIVFLGLLVIWGWNPARAGEPEWIPGQVLVKVLDQENVVFPTVHEGRIIDGIPFPGFENLLTNYKIKEVSRAFKTQSHKLNRIYRFDFQDISGTESLLRDLGEFEFVEYAEKVPLYRTFHTPDDLDLRQWHLFKIEAQAAWDYSQGLPDIVVAIVDDAIRVDHEDLAPRIWTNPWEVPGDSIDNDGNGYIDDLNGYDVADHDPDVMPPSGASDYNFGHGTHVSGIAAAATNNGRGIASIGYNVQIMPVKTKNDSTIGSSTLDATIYGVDYAINTHANVISMSFGGGGFSFSWQILFNEAHDRGIVNVAAAGNDGEYHLSYPAGYTHVINVGSTKGSDLKSGFSNWHPYLDLMAPGSNIYSTAAGEIDHYVNMSGTSMSTPLTSGLCALVMSLDSTLSPDQVLDCMKQGCDNIDALNPEYVGMIGAGRINARKTLECVLFGVGVQEDLTALQTCQVFPNPAHDRLNFTASLPREGDLEIKLVNLLGREMAVFHQGWAAQGEFALSQSLPQGLASGLYLVSWNFEGRLVTQKLLIE